MAHGFVDFRGAKYVLRKAQSSTAVGKPFFIQRAFGSGLVYSLIVGACVGVVSRFLFCGDACK